MSSRGHAYRGGAQDHGCGRGWEPRNRSGRRQSGRLHSRRSWYSFFEQLDDMGYPDLSDIELYDPDVWDWDREPPHDSPCRCDGCEEDREAERRYQDYLAGLEFRRGINREFSLEYA